MSKKKKKAVPLTASQKLKKRFSETRASLSESGKSAVLSGKSTLKSFEARADSFCLAAYNKTAAFMARVWSPAAVAALFLLLMSATYLFYGHAVMTSEFSLTFPFAIPFYLIDFKVGFVSRALVGHIISLFTDKVSLNLIFAIARCSIASTLILQAVIAAFAFKKAFLCRSPLICLLCCFFVCSSVTVVPYMIYLGFIDPFNLLLAIFYYFISNKKAGYVLTPVICVAGVVLHYQFVLAFLPMIFSVELYYIIKNKKGRALRIVSFIISAASSLAVTVYLMFFSKYHVKMDASELYSYMCGKFTDYRSWGLFEEYFTYYIYGDYDGANYSNPADFVKYLLGVSFKNMNLNSMLGYAATLVPAYGLLEYFWIYIFRRTEKKKRLAYLVFMLQPLVVIASFIASTDNARWAGASFFSNFALLFTEIRNEEPLLYEAARKLKSPRIILIISAVFLAGYIITLVTMKKYLT